MRDDALNLLPTLAGAQQQAVQPDSDVWLSASAGTGKTQVLSARVLRLLLQPKVYPQNLLCLTFTKAGAAEMADRINRRLAAWVQMPLAQLRTELGAIGLSPDEMLVNRARKLFARVLDAPGGGLPIMTIHAFCQSLLASFPQEAGLLPGFEPVEGRAEDALLDEALEAVIASTSEPGREWLLDNIRALSLDLGEDKAVEFLRRCARQPQAMDQVPQDSGAVVFVRERVGVSATVSTQELLNSFCGDEAFDRSMLLALLEMNERWSGERGKKRANSIREWLASDVSVRVEGFVALHRCFTKDNGEPLVKSKGYTPPFDEYPDLALKASTWTYTTLAIMNLARYADRLAAALLTGKAMAAHYTALKHQRGLVDFNDMIRESAKLLETPGMGEWVRYKLDQRIDHILVDEAQDTNDAQWAIIEALTEDFYSGAGAGPERARTIFAVGDFKQAIFGFQGTDPQKYRAAGLRFADRMQQVERDLHVLSLARSFRSTKPVLGFVNAVIEEVGYEQLGLSEPPEPHASELGDSGSITLWPPVKNDGATSSDEEDGEEGWLGRDKRIVAQKIADHVQQLVRDKPILASTGKPLVPGDIMILLRSRGALASLLVARLHAADVPVAGIDRLKIEEPIAVQDLLCAIRFVLQPDDDLSLACLLVSPLVGWSQHDLLQYGYRPERMPLWRHVRSQPDLETMLKPLSDLLAIADLTTPFAFLEHILSGPIRGRQKFLARLGSETLVPIDELLNLALQFQQKGGTSLQAFLDWFEKGGVTVKREGLAQSSEVRVMTVHGAKGLEAPVVILADAAGDPDKAGGAVKSLDLELEGRDLRLPLLYAKKEVRSGKLEETHAETKARDLKEHFRLLYVALTRAKEHLLIAGSQGKQKELAPNSWYAACERAVLTLGSLPTRIAESCAMRAKTRRLQSQRTVVKACASQRQCLPGYQTRRQRKASRRVRWHPPILGTMNMAKRRRATRCGMQRCAES